MVGSGATDGYGVRVIVFRVKGMGRERSDRRVLVGSEATDGYGVWPYPMGYYVNESLTHEGLTFCTSRGTATDS